jgi:hypothetical protein
LALETGLGFFAMKDRFIGIGGAIFTVGLVLIPAMAAFYYVIKPIICGVTAGCGVASW